jgi:ketosteroid isomerase-like protein
MDSAADSCLTGRSGGDILRNPNRDLTIRPRRAKEKLMDAKTPELASKLLEACLTENDVDGLEGLYETGAIFVDYEGSAKGWPNIREVHQGFLDEGLSLRLKDSMVFQVDDIALVHWSWTVTHPDGTTTDGTSAEVLRRQADGTWRFVIDNSDGPAPVGIL